MVPGLINEMSVVNVHLNEFIIYLLSFLFVSLKTKTNFIVLVT